MCGRKRNGFASGRNSCVRKPASFNPFAEAVRQLGLYWLVVNETPATNGAAMVRSKPWSEGSTQAHIRPGRDQRAMLNRLEFAVRDGVA
jgi:hypothetical protein